ncbi:MAG: molybdopterin-dependent oxidoreductase [Nitriliruptorales bacterium]|nr:molybdopterin-dependent oxidoreductase [Nitriliruptorales bacterium]
MSKNQVGRSVPRLESEAKVTGTVEYIHNFELPGMLYGKIVRSVLPHARIVGIDSGAALEVPGVRKVVTAAEVRTVTAVDYVGPAFHDQPVLAIDKVVFVGEPVACVLAEDPRAATEAADLVDVEYEELPAVFDEVAACSPDAPLVHERVEASAMFSDLKTLSDRRSTNVILDYQLRRGEVEQGFAEADHVFENTFHSPASVHTTMEPFVSLGEVGDGGLITVHSATQNPSIVQIELARLFGVPENRIRVRTAFLGGGFGAKLYPKLEPLVAVCAMLTRRPVKIALTMDEQFVTLTRHATTIRLKTGVKADGTMVARHCDVTWNTGAYADIGPRVAQKTGFTAAGPYDIKHVWIDSRCVYTNLPPAGAMRGFGVPQVAWAYERQSDIIARELGIDPLAFRERNVLRNGRPHAAGTEIRGAGTEEVLAELRRSMRWDEPLEDGDGMVVRGRGVAFGMKAVITPSTSVAIINLSGDASCRVYCSSVDMGQASDTAYAQIVAEVLGLRTEDVAIVHPDTQITPYDMGTLGSRSLYHMGNALQRAAGEVRDQLLAYAVEHLEIPLEDLDLADGAVVARDGRRMPLPELVAARFGMQAGNVIGRGEFTPSYTKPEPDTGQSPNIAAFWMVGGAGAEVSVDTETGDVKVHRLVVLGDAGRAINPDVVRAQLTGAAVMQLGMACSEEMSYENGQLTNAGLAYYKVPGMLDMPERFEGIVVEFPMEGDAPFGAKGVGETGTFAVAPAVANAVENAAGARVMGLPLTPDRIWEALPASGRPEARS